ncbi:MAG: B12-binding domain-containing radical SAM protein [bacterium]|nr:MAG: B12-binding domain-containing radical SAM protein [bacterium]
MRFKNVVCIYPYFQEVPIYEFFPPIGLEYVAAAIEDHVDDICIIDLRYEENYKKTVDTGADLFCVSVNWHYEFDSVCEVIRSLPVDVMTVIGGKFATENVEELFRRCPNIDVIVRGDGEETLKEFIQIGSPESVEGLSYRCNGRIIHNANRSLSDVSNTLYPNRKRRRYRYRISYKKIGLWYSFDSIVSSQGCPFNCKFCSFKMNPLGQKRDWSARTPESVLTELEEIDAKVVAFIDDNFFVDIKRVERICDLIIEAKLNKIFLANARISIAKHPALLKKMYRAGFRLLMIGLESAHDKSLELLNKGFKTKDVREAFAVLRESKMLTNGYFIVGLFGETKEEMLEIVSYAREIGIDLISPNRLRYEKFSGLARLLEDYDDYYVGEANRIYSKRYGPEEINRIVKGISSGFFNREQLWKIVMKGLRIGFPGWSFYLHLIIALPRIVSQARK